MSRLDRFLISWNWLELFLEMFQRILLRFISDRALVLLSSAVESWGPSPFRFELMWLQEPGFPDLVRNW